MNKEKSLVSIVIPVYNGANYVGEAIDSALAQTYENIEILVINDGSRDDNETENIVLSYGDKVRYYKKENGGVSSALNLGIKNMRGEYFSWLSHDDRYYPDKVKNQVDLLDKIGRKDVIAVCADDQIDKDSNYLGKGAQNEFVEKNMIINMDQQLMHMLKNPSFSGCSLLIPASVFDAVGMFDEVLRYNQDSEMWFKICLAGFGWIYEDYIGVSSRVHNAQVTQTRKDLLQHDSRLFGISYIPKFAEISTKKNNYLYYYALRAAKFDFRENVADCLRFGKEKKLFSFGQKIRIKMNAVYGRLRPAIRRVYYKIFKKVKTR